jgi:hypothetical protein
VHALSMAWPGCRRRSYLTVRQVPTTIDPHA